MSFGEFVKNRRRKYLKKTLRNFCLENGIDPVKMSNMERGLFNPRSRREVQAYKKLLNPDLPEWCVLDEFYELFLKERPVEELAKSLENFRREGSVDAARKLRGTAQKWAVWHLENTCEGRREMGLKIAALIYDYVNYDENV